MTVFTLVKRELDRAVSIHGPMASAHEGYAVILEELDELWEEVRSNYTDPINQRLKNERMKEEAIQVAAMAIRFVIDVCEAKAVIPMARKAKV